jgi:hypothetical protein
MLKSILIGRNPRKNENNTGLKLGCPLSLQIVELHWEAVYRRHQYITTEQLTQYQYFILKSSFNVIIH